MKKTAILLILAVIFSLSQTAFSAESEKDNFIKTERFYGVWRYEYLSGWTGEEFTFQTYPKHSVLTLKPGMRIAYQMQNFNDTNSSYYFVLQFTSVGYNDVHLALLKHYSSSHFTYGQTLDLITLNPGDSRIIGPVFSERKTGFESHNKEYQALKIRLDKINKDNTATFYVSLMPEGVSDHEDKIK